MRIAIIGYGSLVWDLENLAPHVRGNWQLGAGPAMPVEFSRISPKRKNALVLVIDETLDHRCKTSVMESNRQKVEHAITDLAARERCPADMIGYLTTDGTFHHPMECAARWLEKSDYDAVLWTALPGNFTSELQKPFTHRNGREYLKSLSDLSIGEAWRYIEFAPEVTDTPFRRFLATDPFWQSLDYRETAL
ncbi:MAG TPA: hypothetical protein ENJ55_06385 [Rhizobiales bacterium]|nr:hypothetical protein [Hyphomicrobiales bacterium]